MEGINSCLMYDNLIVPSKASQRYPPDATLAHIKARAGKFVGLESESNIENGRGSKIV